MSDLGLVQFRSNEDLVAAEKAEERRQQELSEQRVLELSLVAQIRHDWERAKRAKEPVERRLLDCMRRRNGEYSPEKLAAIRSEGGSEIYMQITATKCRALASWVRDVILSVDRAWGLEPTPVTEIPQPIMAQIQQNVYQQLQQRAQAGETLDMVEEMANALDQIKSDAMDAAKKAAERMEAEIDDQFHEGGWYESLEEFVDDFATFPSAILKGPVLERRPVLSWAEGWQPVKVFEVTPAYYRVSPFDLYPSPEASNCDSAAYLIERVRFTRAALKKMRGAPGIKGESVDEVLQEHGVGGLRDWITIDSERNALEGRHDYLTNDAETIDGLIYTGSAIGLKLLQWGVNPNAVDPLEEYEIEAVMIGRHIIKLIVTNDPLERRKYCKASFQNIPGAFWGTCPPELMSDIQDTCNATARALINNLAMASGPMVEINYDRLAPEEDAEIYPWKVFQTKSSATTGNNPAIRFYQPNSLAGELMTVYNQFEMKADDATNIPRYTYGNEKVGGAGNTMGGLSMLMDAAAKGIKNAIAHIDRNVIRKTVEATWLYNMMYSPDTTLKGDCKVIARGSSALLMRERTQMLRNEFLMATNNPTDQRILGIEGRAKLLATSARNLDIPDLMGSDEEIMARIAKEDEGQMAMQQETAQMDTEERMARIGELKAKAGKLRAETASEGIESRKTMTETRKLEAEISDKKRNPQPVEGGRQPQARQLGLQGVDRAGRVGIGASR